MLLRVLNVRFCALRSTMVSELIVRVVAVRALLVNWRVPPTLFVIVPKLLAPLFKVCVPLDASNVTVLLPGVNVPPLFAQLPETVKVPEGAVRVPLERVKTPFTSTSPEDPVNVPPDTVRPPLKVCVAVFAWLAH